MRSMTSTPVPCKQGQGGGVGWVEIGLAWDRVAGLRLQLARAASPMRNPHNAHFNAASSPHLEARGVISPRAAGHTHYRALSSCSKKFHGLVGTQLHLIQKRTNSRLTSKYLPSFSAPLMSTVRA